MFHILTYFDFNKTKTLGMKIILKKVISSNDPYSKKELAINYKTGYETYEKFKLLKC